MRCHLPRRHQRPPGGAFGPIVKLFLAPGIIAAAAAAAPAPEETVTAALADFRQKGSGVCVHYAHIVAWAEWDPRGFLERMPRAGEGWDVRLADGRTIRVGIEEDGLSLRNGFAGGSPGNPINVTAIAASKAGGGFDAETGRLDYGTLVADPKIVVGTGVWTLYDDHQESPGRTWADGLDRLVRESEAGGRLRRPATIGFGDLAADEPVRIIAERCGLVGAHDFTVAGCDPATGTVRLRNPHNPTKITEAAVDDLRRLPGGIDFMEPPRAPPGMPDHAADEHAGGG